MTAQTEGAPVPAYISIASALRDRISAGQLATHSLVPSERELSRDFGVSRMTARQALGILESEGAVYRRPPRGTFVAEPRFPLRLGSFSDEVTSAGRTPTAEVIWAERQAASPVVADALGLVSGAEVHALQRLRRGDGEPLAIETTYYPVDLTPGLLEQPLDGSLWAMLREHYGVHPARATATIEVITLDGAATQRFGVRSAAPGILLTRRTYAHDDRCIEFARDTYRADRSAFELESRISTPGETSSARRQRKRSPGTAGQARSDKRERGVSRS